ncbi:MAG: hypothetical protein CM1200mP10_11900 [Candidatus Neomarinimicrobiota bacterium]|nr:MAG: hypothetical protein CM1200mP10_11900 [Candidatus Neomarinimicrobiota bacterium]
MDQAFSVTIADSAAVGIAVLNVIIEQDDVDLNSFEISINIGKHQYYLLMMIMVVWLKNFILQILDSMYVPYSIWDRMNGPLTYAMVQNSPIIIWLTEWAFFPFPRF